MTNREETTEKLNVDWKNVRDKIRSEYENIADEDFEFMEGRTNADAINRLQQKTGKTKAEIRDWLQKLNKAI